MTAAPVAIKAAGIAKIQRTLTSVACPRAYEPAINNSASPARIETGSISCRRMAHLHSPEAHLKVQCQRPGVAPDRCDGSLDLDSGAVVLGAEHVDFAGAGRRVDDNRFVGRHSDH